MALNRTLKVTKNEWTFFGTLLPYLAMVLGAVLTLALGVITRLGITIQEFFNIGETGDTARALTLVVISSAVILGTIAWKLFRQRRGQFIAPHATATVLLGHAWILMAIWENPDSWMFGVPTLYAFFYGAIIVALSWCIRRWAFRDEDGYSDESINPFEVIGLGNSAIDGKNSKMTAQGARYRLKLALGKTIENAKDARVKIAQIAQKPRSRVHIRETPEAIEGEVDIVILQDDPFQEKTPWQGPDYPGDSIASPISYATYDDGTRPNLYLAGKNGASSQHFLTMGMSGAGKSKAWQVIYGSVLNRREVSVVFGDLIKGMQTGGPLASGLEWFAMTEDECHQQIQAIMRAIPARTNYLTEQGLGQWQPGCGLNFVIFHLEEAARFADVEELVGLIEAARSAGISIVISLQRATNDRLKTSARYNLGGSMCFGVRDKRDTQLGLSEYSRMAGAEPHLWQDRQPGRHYLEASGIDVRMFGHSLETDWLDEKHLQQEVDAGQEFRTPLDFVTAQAFGPAYQNYRNQVANQETQWQRLRINRSSRIDSTQEIPAVIEGDIITPHVTKPNNLSVSPEERQEAENELWAVIEDLRNNGQTIFSPKDLLLRFTTRKGAWVSKKLKSWVREGRLQEVPGHYGMYQISD